MLKDTDDRIKVEAVKALKELAEGIPVKYFIEALHDREWEVREATVTAVSNANNKIPLDILVIALEDTNVFVRRAAIKALVLHQGHISVKNLLLALEEEDPIMRQYAVKAIGEQREIKLLEPLIGLIGDQNEEVRKVAILALEKLALEELNKIVPEAIAILKGKPSPGNIIDSLNQMYIADLIGEIGNYFPTLLDQLTSLLDWHFWQVRLRAIWSFNQIRRNIPDEAIKRLLDLRQDPVRLVREAADDTLANILSLETGIEDD